jgi:hypothetical protein
LGLRTSPVQTPGGIIPFRWATSFRYGGRNHLVMVGGFARNQHEWRMADLVCGGQLGLATAQKAIRDNWVDAYRAYIGER